MIRLLALAVGLALVAATLPVEAPVPAPAPGQAEAAECRWERHTKRVVKRVRRHGRVRKIVRRKHRWTCVPVATPAPAPALVPPPPPPPDPPIEEEANRLSVRAAEYFYVLSRPAVRTGNVTVELNNRGEDPHNLNLREEGTEGEPLQVPETASLQRSVASFDLEAGSYRLWCSLPEHEALGMYVTLQVE